MKIDICESCLNGKICGMTYNEVVGNDGLLYGGLTFEYRLRNKKRCGSVCRPTVSVCNYKEYKNAVRKGIQDKYHSFFKLFRRRDIKIYMNFLDMDCNCRETTAVNHPPFKYTLEHQLHFWNFHNRK